MSVHVIFVMDKVALKQGFLRVLRCSLVSIIPPMLHTHLQLHVVLSRTNRRNLGNFQKQCYVGSQGVLEMKGTFTGSAVARRY